MRQCQRQTHPNTDCAAHHSHQQVPFVLGQMRPFDALAALRSHDQLIGHLTGEQFETFVTDHREKSPANNNAKGLRSAFAARTASLIFSSSLSPSSRTMYSIPNPCSTGIVWLPMVA